MTDERKDQLTAEADGLIEGRNAVIEALRTEASIDKIFICFFYNFYKTEAFCS